MPLNCLQFLNVPLCLVLFETTSLIGFAFLQKFTCLCEGRIGLSNWMVFEIDSFNLWFKLNIINLKVYLVLSYENCTPLNRDDLVPMFLNPCNI